MFKIIYKWTDKIKDKVAALSAKLNEKGQGMVEYAIILAAVAIIAVAALWGSGNDKGLSGAVTEAFGKATGSIQEANSKTAADAAATTQTADP